MEFDEYYDLFVDEGEEEIELELDDTEVKPEQVKDVIPAYEPQTVYPDPGMTIGQVNVAAIPDPTAVKDISENGDHNVARYGTARVNVQPNLQTPDPITPTKSQQTVAPSAGYDGLANAVVEPIPSEYIVPAGKITLTENDTDVDISQYEKADVAVPVPVMPEEYAIGGSYGNSSLTGYHFSNNATAVKISMFADCKNLVTIENIPSSVTVIANYFAQRCANLENCELPDSIYSIGLNSFAQCTKLKMTHLPLSLTTLTQGSFDRCSSITISEIPEGLVTIPNVAFWYCTGIQNILFLGDIQRIEMQAFRDCSNCLVFDFRNNTAVPTLDNTNAFSGGHTNRIFVVPDDLVSTWRTATNWVSYSDKIIGVSEYEAS